MTSDNRVIEILKALAKDPTDWGQERLPGFEGANIGAGEITELAGRGLIHEPGFQGWWEPTLAGRQVLAGTRQPSGARQPS